MIIGSYIRQVSIAVAVILPSLSAHEGISLKPYQDIAGVETVCYGETEGIEDREYTKSECLLRLAQRVAVDYEAPIAKCTESPKSKWVELPITVRSASISLAYNIGVGAFCKSSVNRELKAGNLEVACDKFLLWNKYRKNGRLRVSKGLTNRRHDERNLCLEGITIEAA